MSQKDELRNFEEMWTWLYEHPGHDQQYYIENVAKLEEKWANNCPLCNNAFTENCDGCSMLWNSGRESLCTDLNSPLNKWTKATAKGDADQRSYYAGQLRLLAQKCIDDMG